MTMEEVLAFLRRILTCAQDDAQAMMMLAQFERIISARAMEDDDMREAVKIINQAKYAVKEGVEIARKKDRLTAEDLEIAQRRFSERIARERAMNRC